jgi:hypothetical protein
VPPVVLEKNDACHLLTAILEKGPTRFEIWSLYPALIAYYWFRPAMQSNNYTLRFTYPALLPHYRPCCRRVWEFFRNSTIKLLSLMGDSCLTNHLVVKSLIALRPSDDIAATYMSRLAISTVVPDLLSE